MALSFPPILNPPKNQVEQIKSPPLSSPRRRGIDHRNNPSSNGSGKDVPVDAMPRIYQTPCERQPQQRPGFSGMSDDDHDGGSDEDIDWSVGDGPPVIDSVTPLAERLEGPAEEKGWGREDAEGREAREAHDAEDLSAGGESPVVGATAAARCRGGRRRGDDASRSAALRRCNSQQQTARLTAAAAAVETAAAVVAAISPVGLLAADIFVWAVHDANDAGCVVPRRARACARICLPLILAAALPELVLGFAFLLFPEKVVTGRRPSILAAALTTSPVAVARDTV